MTTVKAIKKRIKLNEQKLNIEHPLFTIFGGGGTFHRWNSTREHSPESGHSRPGPAGSTGQEVGFRFYIKDLLE